MDRLSEIQRPLTEFGNFLRELRLRSNLTQSALSRLIGVSKQTVYEWERKRTFPSKTRVLRKIAVALRVPLQEFAKVRQLRMSALRSDLMAQHKDPVVSNAWPHYVPVVGSRVQTLPLEQIKNPSTWKSKHCFLPKNILPGFVYGFEIPDGSMEPDHRRGDVALADMRRPAEETGPAVIKIKGLPVLFRICSSRKDTKVLRTLSGQGPELRVKESDIEWCHGVIRVVDRRSVLDKVE